MADADLGRRHHVRQGPVAINLQDLDSNPTIVPADSDRSLFSLRSADSMRQYAAWADFVDDLSNSLGAGKNVRILHAYGSYATDSNTFRARKLGIILVEPQL